MTKDELKQEAEESAKQNCPMPVNWNEIDVAEKTGYIKGYIAGAEPREKRIEVLEELLDECGKSTKELVKENAELKAELAKKADTNHSLVEQMADLESKNAELKEKLEATEKARDYWKDSSFDWRHKCTSRKPFRVAVKAQKQLTKAKELLEELYDCIPASSADYYKETLQKVADFLKGIEVEK